MSAELTVEERVRLIAMPVTLDGKPAKISGCFLPFPSVSDFAGRSYQWSWEAVNRIVSSGGNFKS